MLYNYLKTAIRSLLRHRFFSAIIIFGLAVAMSICMAMINPGLKVDYTEVESEINKYYDLVFGDLVKVLGSISFLAIFISCLGLLGMATYATETRIKEISIRKILGSSSMALVLLLSKGFLVMLGLAIGIGIPLSYFVKQLMARTNCVSHQYRIGRDWDQCADPDFFRSDYNRFANFTCYASEPCR